MQTMSANWQSNITAPARYVKCKVELYNGSTLLHTFLPDGNLQSVSIEADAAQLFGFTSSQKLTISLIDKDGAITASKGNICRVYIGTANGNETEYANRCRFYVDECTRKDCNVTITAYDALSVLAGKDVIGNLDVDAPFTIQEYASAIASYIGLSAVFDSGTCNNLTYTEDALPNLSGRETLRDVLKSIAEATGTVCYMDSNNNIRFRVLSATSALSITKSDYFSFSVENGTTLTGVTSATELGDNVTAGDSSGFNQILRDNPFIVNRSDIPDILTAILTQNSAVGIVPYKLKWRGNPAVEYGDTVTVTKPDDTTVNVVYLGETLKYTGGLSAESDFDTPQEEVPQSNPASIGERINQTIARVDKVNNEITLLSQTTSDNTENIASLMTDSTEIKGTVSELKKDNETSKQQLTELTQKSSSIELSVQSIQDDGVSKVTTSTGFTFDENGLTIDQSDSATKTVVDETGLTVKDTSGSSEKELLYVGTSDDAGEGIVRTDNIRVSRYLIVGSNSRFEDYVTDDDDHRTGCFYIGG